MYVSYTKNTGELYITPCPGLKRKKYCSWFTDVLPWQGSGGGGGTAPNDYEVKNDFGGKSLKYQGLVVLSTHSLTRSLLTNSLLAQLPPRLLVLVGGGDSSKSFFGVNFCVLPQAQKKEKSRFWKWKHYCNKKYNQLQTQSIKKHSTFEAKY